MAEKGSESGIHETRVTRLGLFSHRAYNSSRSLTPESRPSLAITWKLMDRFDVILFVSVALGIPGLQRPLPLQGKDHDLNLHDVGYGGS